MRVSLTGLTKRFGANTANDAVSVDFTSAGVHTLLGENGAGKTTLVRMLAGLLQPDAGTIAIDGTAVAIRSPKEAIALGIALVSQHPVIAGHLTVFENIVTSGALARRGLFDQAALRKRVTEVASSCGIAFDLDRRAEAAGLSVQKHIEIVRALLADARLIIFDEPTDVLTPAESEQFFRLIRRLAASGKTIVLITHFLREAIAHSDSITILRKGRVVASLVPSETSPADLAERMVGALPPVAAASVRELHEGTAIVLSADNVSIVEAGKRAVRNVSLSVRQGEILGIAGVAGNGQEELVEALVGLRAVAEGRIAIDGKTVAPGDTRRLIRSDRLGYVPADRHRDGLAGLMSVSDNLTFEIVERPSLSRLGLLNRSAAAAHAKGLIERFDVQPPAPGLTAERLSGGNQQKLILARVLDRRPSLLVVCNPARGLDVGATRWVWDAIRRVRNENGAVVLLSGDLEEIRSLSDRIAVFFRGAISGELLPAEASSDRLGLLMGGSSDAA